MIRTAKKFNEKINSLIVAVPDAKKGLDKIREEALRIAGYKNAPKRAIYISHYSKALTWANSHLR